MLKKIALLCVILSCTHTTYSRIFIQNLTNEKVHVRVQRGGTIIKKDMIMPPMHLETIGWECSYDTNIKVIASDSSKGLKERAGNYQFWDHDGAKSGKSLKTFPSPSEGQCGCVAFWILRKDPVLGWEGWTTWEGSDGRTRKGQFIVTHGRVDIHPLPASDGRAKYGAGDYYFFQDDRPISRAYVPVKSGVDLCRGIGTTANAE